MTSIVIHLIVLIDASYLIVITDSVCLVTDGISCYDCSLAVHLWVVYYLVFADSPLLC